MGWVTGIGVVITALDVGFADLPDEAFDYTGHRHSVEQFYDQEVPNILLGGYYSEGRTTIPFGIDTGTHTSKLDTYGASIGAYHTLPLADSNSDITFGAKLSLDYIEHRPCIDEYNAEYYCGNLTPFSDLERKADVQVTPSISINYTLRF